MKKLLAFLLAAMICLGCFAACTGNKTPAQKPVDGGEEEVVYDVKDAAAYLKNMYKKYLVEVETAADYELVSQVLKGGVVYTVEWTTDRDDIKVIANEETKTVTIDLNEKTKVVIEYTLTATIKDPDGKSETISFKLKVPEYKLLTFKEYMDTAAGKAVVVEGYVVAIHSQAEGNKYNQLYVQDKDGKGGYYVYSMAKDPVKDLGLKNGMLVSVTGTKDIYSGTHEVKDAAVIILDKTATTVSPLDITKIFKDAKSLKDEALVSKLGMLVTIKGVEITDQDLSEKSMYMNFKLSGLTSYIRVYATDCPASVSDDDMKAIIETHGKKKNYSADVTGVVVLYNGAIYLNPVSKDCFKYGSLIKRDDAAKVDVEIENVLLETEISLNKVIELPLKGKDYEEVAISWATDNEEAVSIGEDGKASVKLQKEATTVKLTATFTLNAVTKTHVYTLNLAAAPTIVPQAVATPVAGTAYKFFYAQKQLGEYRFFNGTAGSYYGNTTNVADEAVDVYLEAATGGYYMYFNDAENGKTYIEAYMSGTYCNLRLTQETPASVWVLDAELNNTPVVTLGTEKYFLGTYGEKTDLRPTKYSFATSDTNYIAYFGTMVDTNAIPDADKVATEKDALSVETEFIADTEIDLALKGSIHSDVAISWASNNAAAVVDGGKLTVTLGNEEQTVTLTATITLGDVTETKTFTLKIKAKGYNLTSIAEANTIGAGKNHNQYTSEDYFIAGVITKIENTQYGNCYITDELGNSIYVYGLKDSSGNTRYDALTDKPVVGDYIIVASPIGKYNSAVQLKNAKILEHIAATSIPDANTIGAAQPNKGDATEEWYLVNGEITAISNTTYGNATIKDANGNLLTVYGMYSFDGETKYGSLTTKPEVGDTVTLYGVLSNYNGAQIKNARIYCYIAAPEEGGDDTVEGGIKVTLTPSSLGLANAAVFSSATLDNVITVSASKASGSNDPAYYNSGTNLRIYTNNTFTVTAASGYKISSIKFVCSSEKSMLTNAITVSPGTAAYDTSNKTTTITGINASSFSFKNTKTGSDSESKQVRIARIEVTYVAE